MDTLNLIQTINASKLPSDYVTGTYTDGIKKVIETKYIYHKIYNEHGKEIKISTNIVLNFNATHSLDIPKYYDLEYIELATQDNYSLFYGRFIPVMLKYNRWRNKYKTIKLDSTLSQVYPSKLVGIIEEDKKNKHKWEAPMTIKYSRRVPKGSVLLQGTHYYINWVIIPTYHMGCFIMKDLTNDGPVKLFCPFTDIHEIYESYAHLVLTKIENGLCHFEMPVMPRCFTWKEFVLDMAKIYSINMYSLTDTISIDLIDSTVAKVV